MVLSRRNRVLLLALAVMVTAVVVSYRTFVLRLPASVVESVVFRDLEVGGATTAADVSEEFEIRKISKLEFWSDSSRPFPSELEGATFFKARLGAYRGLPFRVNVVALFAFDTEGRLVFAEVQKQYDAL